MRPLLALAFLTVLAAVSVSPQTSSTTVLEHVTVLPMTDAAPALADHTVVIRGARIESVAPTAKIRVPEGARRVDGTGKFLMPGLADMHVHLEYFNEPTVLAAFLYNGITRVRNMDGRPYILEWKKKTASGELLGPAIHTAAPLLDGDPPLRADNTIVRDVGEARATVAAQAQAGYDFIKVYGNLRADTYRAILAAARQHDRPVAGHVPRSLTINDVIDAGQTAIEHLNDYDDAVEADDSPFKGKFHWSKPLLGMPFDAAKAAALAQKQAKAGVWAVPTAVQADRALAPADIIKRWLAEPEMQYIPGEGHEIWRAQMDRSTRRMDEEDWKLVARGRTNRLALLRALHAARVPLLTGTDTPNPHLVPGFSLVHELENFVAAGLTPAETLVIATREAARFVGDLEASGTVQAGKRADLLLLDANPLDAIGNVRRVHGVFVHGRWHTRDELGKLLRPLR